MKSFWIRRMTVVYFAQDMLDRIRMIGYRGHDMEGRKPVYMGIM